MVARTPLLNRAVLVTLVFGCFGGLPAVPAEKDDLGPPPILTSKPLKEAAGDGEQQKLLKDLYNERLALTAAYYRKLREGRFASCDIVLDPARRLLRAGMELYPRPADKSTFLKQMLQLAERVEGNVKYYGDRGGFYQGDALVFDVHKAHEFKLEVELEIVKAKKAAGEK